MKRALLLVALLLAAAGYVFLQTTRPALKPAALMPGGALLYLEAPDFGRLLREWDSSQVKTAWLESANYEVFAQSNLFQKLQEVYGQYAAAASFAPELKSVLEIAGTESALALYEIRDVEFLYISRVGEAQLARSQLWAVRDKFEQRQAGGVSFYLRTDAASKRTVAFALANGYLLLATRDDLVAHALELMAGGTGPSVASSRWYTAAAAQAQSPGELRLVMNLEALVRSVYFRSYWVQRNASALRKYWAGVADVRRADGTITESRLFLKAAEQASAGPVSHLLGLVPPEAGVYKAFHAADASEVAELIVRKLIAAPPRYQRDSRIAPYGVSADIRAGSEADLEQRIDEPELRSRTSVGAAVEAARKFGGARDVLLVQASAAVGETFARMNSVIVLAAEADWNAAAVRGHIAALQRTSGVAAVLFEIRGKLLFLGNDAGLLAAVVNRAAAPPPARRITYAAGFRHARERANFERIMTALDFGTERGGPAFFSGNLASLSRVLSGIGEVDVAEEDRAGATLQTVVYR